MDLDSGAWRVFWSARKGRAGSTVNKIVFTRYSMGSCTIANAVTKGLMGNRERSPSCARVFTEGIVMVPRTDLDRETLFPQGKGKPS
mmetsp:Transcript_5421/g.7546  ORF Transcript_5421/g.7546 Transcript_5421/m.7546 type:complete len:87 (+) Transcript_5421:1876-2136(+)